MCTMKKQENNMNSSKDYEQLYYDAIYQIRKLERKCNVLEEENNIYKELLKNKPLKLLIADTLVKYERSKNGGKK